VRSPGHGIAGFIASDRGLAGVGLRGGWGLLLLVARSRATGFRHALPERWGRIPPGGAVQPFRPQRGRRFGALGVGRDDRRDGDRHASMEGVTASLDGEAQGADLRSTGSIREVQGESGGMPVRRRRGSGAPVDDDERPGSNRMPRWSAANPRARS
jgi:hypothetical protein